MFTAMQAMENNIIRLTRELAANKEHVASAIRETVSLYSTAQTRRPLNRDEEPPDFRLIDDLLRNLDVIPSGTPNEDPGGLIRPDEPHHFDNRVSNLTFPVAKTAEIISSYWDFGDEVNNMPPLKDWSDYAIKCHKVLYSCYFSKRMDSGKVTLKSGEHWEKTLLLIYMEA